MTTPAQHITDEDERQLAEMGYKQDLNRTWSAFSNFAISFTIISVLAGCFTTYGQAWNNGGPIAISWGWPLISIPILIIGFSMSELVAKYPTAGGIYWWAARLGGPVWGWFTGWFNFLGLIGVVASVVYASATFMNFLLGSLGVDVLGVNFTDGEHFLKETFLLFVIIILLHAILNITRTNFLALINNVSVFWHVVGVAVIIAILVIAPDDHQSFDFVFTERFNNSGFTDGSNSSGLLLALRIAAGLPAHAVHDHRVRRLGSRLRGDARSVEVGRSGRMAVDLLFGVDRLVRAPCDHVRRDQHGLRERSRERLRDRLGALDPQFVSRVRRRSRRCWRSPRSASCSAVRLASPAPRE